MRFHNRAIFIYGFHFSINRLMPFEYAFMFWVFRSKTLNFLEMSFKIEMFIIVSVGGYCARDICSEQRPHNFNKIIQRYFKLDNQVRHNNISIQALVYKRVSLDRGGDLVCFGCSILRPVQLQTLQEIMEQYDKNNSDSQYLIESKSVSSVHSNPEVQPVQPVQIQQEYPLIERYYHTSRKNQYENLLETNINALLKKKLFGFSKSADIYYKTNFDTQLVFEQHPLKGRTIMPLQKFQQREFDRQRAAQIQQTNMESKQVKPKSIYVAFPVVVRNNQKNPADPQVSPKKTENIDESAEDLLAVGSEKNLIEEERI